jgi:hypothetical protein
VNAYPISKSQNIKLYSKEVIKRKGRKMIHDVVSANYMNEYKNEIEFDDGKKGIIDFVKYFKKRGIF